MLYKIVETCNFDGDYPNESFLNLPPMKERFAKSVAEEINSALISPSGFSPRYWKVVPEDYKLRPGFEP